MRHKLGTGPSKARNPLPSCCTMRDSPPPQFSLGSPWLWNFPSTQKTYQHSLQPDRKFLTVANTHRDKPSILPRGRQRVVGLQRHLNGSPSQQIVPNGQFLNKRIPITDPVHGLQFGAEEACTRGPASSHNPL
jgi:hypothetical protein